MTDDLRIQLQEQARQAAYWKERAEYWRDMWSKAANEQMKCRCKDNFNPWKEG